MLRARSVIALAVALGACDPDQGQPSDAIIVQDGGNEGGDEAASGGLKANGAVCTTAAECASGICFLGGKESFCTIPCTTENAVSACAAAPFIGVCNMQGFCKIN